MVAAPQSIERDLKVDFDRFVKQLEIGLDEGQRRISFDLFGRCISGNPVDTGRSRNSWFISQGAPSSAELPEGDYPKGGSDALARISEIQPGQFDAIFITNNLKYIVPLEFGHSQQAPSGWVRTAIADIEAQIEALIGARP